jgi:cytokinesis protein
MVGNYMNDTRKQASGFKLQSLARMAGVKDEHNISFLHHVERVIRTAFPDLEHFMDDLKPCREAAMSMLPMSKSINRQFQCWI